jgi:hypothetical protein
MSMLRPSLLLAALLLAGGAQAQSARSTALAPLDPEQLAEFSAPSPGSSSFAVACTPGQQLSQTAAATTAFGAVAGGQELGQSFVAPCDGNLNSVLLIVQNSTTSTPGAFSFGSLRVYEGAGTAGAVVASQTFRLPNPPAAGTATGATFYPFRINAPMVQGQTYTFFVDMSSGSTAIQGTLAGAGPPVVPDAYANGTLVFTSNGNPVPSSSQANADLSFILTFNSTTVTQASVFNGPGWRLLSTPVANVPVQELSDMNLVQGFLSQYPSAPPNLLQNYLGNGAFAAQQNAGGTLNASAAAVFTPVTGRGFFWYWYDQAISPDSTSFGGGTSDSRELTGFTLSATGRAPDVSAPTTNFARTMPQLNADGFYMLGNPFSKPLAVTGITRSSGATTGTLGTTFFVYDPAISNYQMLFTSNPANGNASDYLAVWQGVFAQLSGATATTAPQFNYLVASTSATATAPFYGRTGTTSAPYLQLMLDGTTATGAELHDVAAYVRFTPAGLATWDADDASKLALPPGVAHALLAPVGVDEFGDRERLAVNSFSDASVEPVTVPVDFKATEAGAFTVSWAGATELPEGWAATLTDHMENVTVDLRQTPDYSFTADATDWTERFTLLVSPRGAVAGEGTPDAVRVGTFAPNPSTSTSRLSFTVEAAQTVRAVVVDALGREVAVLFEGSVAPGAERTLTLDAGRLSPGMYVVRITGETFAETRRLTVVR